MFPREILGYEHIITFVCFKYNFSFKVVVGATVRLKSSGLKC